MQSKRGDAREEITEGRCLDRPRRSKYHQSNSTVVVGVSASGIRDQCGGGTQGPIKNVNEGARKERHHQLSSSKLAGSMSSHLWSFMSRAYLRLRKSVASMGSRNSHSASESSSFHKYFSIITRFSGQGFKLRIYRNAPKTRRSG